MSLPSSIWNESLQSIALPLFLAFATVVAIFFILRTTKSPNRKNTPPSPSSLPLLGHLHHLGRFPHRSLQALSSIHGPIMLLRFGNTPTIILSSASLVKKSIEDHDIALANRPRLTMADILFYGSSDVALSPYGEYWRQARRICDLHLLSTSRLKSFQRISEQEVSSIVDKVHSGCFLNGDGGYVVNLRQMFVKLMNDILCGVSFGQKYSSEEMNHIQGLFRDFSERLEAPLIGEIVPFLGWMDCLTGVKRRAKKTAQEIDRVFEKAIEDHLKAKIDVLDTDQTDLLDVLLNITEIDKEIGSTLSRDNIKAIILDMFRGGTVTVAAALEWTMAELIKNPKEMKKVQKEIRDVTNKSGKLSENLTEKMTCLKAAIKEALRLHPPAPLLIPRESTKDIKLFDYHVPAGTQFVINAWAIGRDPLFWERAQEFCPQRFTDNSVDLNEQQFGFIPFGTGKRVCPGINFAGSIIEFVLASLLYHFDWKLTNGMDAKSLDMTEETGLVLNRKANLVLVAEPHNA